MSVTPKEEKTAFEKFIEKHNENYVMKCKELGLKNEYIIESSGKPLAFTRNRLTTRQFNELEQTRQKAEKENLDNVDDPMSAANRTANVYLKIAQAYLKNKDTGQPITKEEYENCIWEDIRIVLDACHLRTVIGVGN